MAHEPRRKRNRLPKDVSKLTDDEVMEKVFSKRVRDELRKEVTLADRDRTDDKKGK